MSYDDVAEMFCGSVWILNQKRQFCMRLRRFVLIDFGVWRLKKFKTHTKNVKLKFLFNRQP